MSWTIVCQSNSYEEFEACTPSVDSVPAGTKIKMTLQTPFYLPIAPFFDLAGMETLASFMDPVGVNVTDVEGVGLNTIIIHGEVPESVGIGIGPVAVALIIGGFVAGLAAIGITVFVLMKLEVLLPLVIDAMRWMVYGVLALTALVLVGSVGYRYSRRK